MKNQEIYNEIVIEGQKVLDCAQSAKGKTQATDKLAKLMITAALQDDNSMTMKLNNLFIKDAVFYGLRKIKSMASLSVLVLREESKISYEIGKGDNKKFLSVSLNDAKENKWNEEVKISSIYSFLKERSSGVSITDREAWAAISAEHPHYSGITLQEAKIAFSATPEVLDSLLQEGRSLKELSLTEQKAQAIASTLFEQFKTLPPQEAHSFLIQANVYLELQEAA